MVFRARSSPKRPSLLPPGPGPPPGRVSTSTPPGCFRAARSHHDATCSSAPSPGSVSAAQHARKKSLRSARESARAKRAFAFRSPPAFARGSPSSPSSRPRRASAERRTVLDHAPSPNTSRTSRCEARSPPPPPPPGHRAAAAPAAAATPASAPPRGREAPGGRAAFFSFARDPRRRRPRAFATRRTRAVVPAAPRASARTPRGPRAAARGRRASRRRARVATCTPPGRPARYPQRRRRPARFAPGASNAWSGTRGVSSIGGGGASTTRLRRRKDGLAASPAAASARPGWADD